MNGNNRRRSGTSTSPLAGRSQGVKTLDWNAVEQHLAAAFGSQTRQREHQRALPGRVGADKADDLTGAHGEIDAVQHLHGPIECIEVFDLKQAASPHQDRP